MPNAQSSGDNDACQLKAGHPPAVKVGNMRVTQRTHSTSSSSGDAHQEEEKSGGECCVPSACSFAPKTVVKTATSGVPDTIVQSVPEAVKQFHEKPQVKHEYRGNNPKTNVIQQPKK